MRSAGWLVPGHNTATTKARSLVQRGKIIKNVFKILAGTDTGGVACTGTFHDNRESWNAVIYRSLAGDFTIVKEIVRSQVLASLREHPRVAHNRTFAIHGRATAF